MPPGEAGDRDPDVVGDDARRHECPVLRRHVHVPPSRGLAARPGLRAPEHDVRQELGGEGRPLAQEGEAGRGRHDEREEGEEHVPARLDHGRRALAREHDPDPAPGAPLVAVERVVSRRRQPLEPGQGRRARAVGAGPREVGRDLAIAGREVRQLVRAEAVEALGGRAPGQPLELVPAVCASARRTGCRPRPRPARRGRPAGGPARRRAARAGAPRRSGPPLPGARPAEPRARRPGASVPPGRGRPAARRTGPAAGTSRRRARESRAAPPRRGPPARARGASWGRSRLTIVPATRSPSRLPRGWKATSSRPIR